MSISTTWRWLKWLDFSYDQRKKSFFVDGHERPDVVFRRNEFCSEYLKKLEPRTHRWLQVKREIGERWITEKKKGVAGSENRGYKYMSEEGEEMVEFHLDNLDLRHEEAGRMGFGTFGGNLSVRRLPGKPIMMFGQDEGVYNQFLLGSRNWVGPKGERPLLPKTDGLSLMMSAFQSRETGFGVNINRIKLEEINEYRRGTKYVDGDSRSNAQKGSQDITICCIL